MLDRAPSSQQVMARSCYALGDETRLDILGLLQGCERCVCELTARLDAAQSRLSFHLKVLKDAGLISHRKQGRWSYYALVPEALREIEDFLRELRTAAGPAAGAACGAEGPACGPETPAGAAGGPSCAADGPSCAAAADGPSCAAAADGPSCATDGPGCAADGPDSAMSPQFCLPLPAAG